MGAVVLGWYIAKGEIGLPAMVAGILGLWIASRVTRIRADALVTGAVVAGYLVGNRGFAQLHFPSVPLLPGEAALGLGLTLMLWRAAKNQTLPVRRDALNLLLILWLLIGAVRLPMDFRIHQFSALRDFAMVYYALFFFVAQDWADLVRERRWVQHCLLGGVALTAPIFMIFSFWPGWFLVKLTVFGTPLIFVKSDVAGGFMAAGVIWFAHQFARTRRFGWLALCAVSLVGLVLCNSRAALVALVAAVAWLLVLRAWPTLRVLGLLVALAFLGLVIHAAVSPRSFATTPLYRIYESVASVADVSGTRTYRAGDLGDKPDNNQFRLVWWRTVIDRTWVEGRWLGLGFGHDLAADFLQIYYGEATEDFTARSPHSFLLSIFGRMGGVGFAILLAILTAIAIRTWRAGRHEGRAEPGSEPVLPLWIGAWAIFISACFGVVLESPMGAVVFWTMLGLANGLSHQTREEDDTVEPPAGEP